MRATQLTLANNQLELRFSVADTGIGIALEAAENLFSAFHQADNSITRQYGGSGLGLAICKQLAELQGGEIGFESIPDAGSTFWFTIVCGRGDVDSIETDLWSVDQAVRDELGVERRSRILVAGDNQVNQTIALSMLGQLGHYVDVVANGIEAVSAVLRVPYDLVMMDINMPEMDGPTATGKIRALQTEAASIPIIALTANAMTGDREKYIAAGMNDYVAKPIEMHKLADAIRRQCGVEATHGSAVPPAPAITASPEKNAELTDLLDFLDDLIEVKR